MAIKSVCKVCDLPIMSYYADDIEDVWTHDGEFDTPLEEYEKADKDHQAVPIESFYRD